MTSVLRVLRVIVAVPVLLPLAPVVALMFIAKALDAAEQPMVEKPSIEPQATRAGDALLRNGNLMHISA